MIQERENETLYRLAVGADVLLLSAGSGPVVFRSSSRGSAVSGFGVVG